MGSNRKEDRRISKGKTLVLLSFALLQRLFHNLLKGLIRALFSLVGLGLLRRFDEALGLVFIFRHLFLLMLKRMLLILVSIGRSRAIRETHWNRRSQSGKRNLARSVYKRGKFDWNFPMIGNF